MIGRGNRSTRRKPAPALLFPQILYNLTRAWTRATAVGIQRLTAWAMTRPGIMLKTELLTCVSCIAIRCREGNVVSSRYAEILELNFLISLFSVLLEIWSLPGKNSSLSLFLSYWVIKNNTNYTKNEFSMLSLSSELVYLYLKTRCKDVAQDLKLSQLFNLL
jgi:hypothetical protein